MRYLWTLATFLLTVMVVAAVPLAYGQGVPAFEAADAQPAHECAAPMPMPMDMSQPDARCATSADGQADPSSAAQATPVAGEPCPGWVHDEYVTVGSDGKSYATWHPATDPRYGCVFGHEHGADPRTSRANAELPAFGYAAAQMGMVEPHVGFKVFVLNDGDVVESNVPSKVANEDVRVVFHMGTAGVNRYTQQFHSIQYDVVDHSTGRSAHVTGMADTGPVGQAGSTCDTPRRGGKDFSSLGCADTYEIWNAVRFQIFDPTEPFTGLTESRFAVVPSVAVFDPITTRDPTDNTRLVYTQALKPNPAYITGVAPTSPEAYYQGCRREFYSGPAYWKNDGQPTVYYTDALGHVAPDNQPDAEHPIQQEVSGGVGYQSAIYKLRQDFCGNGIHAPN